MPMGNDVDVTVYRMTGRSLTPDYVLFDANMAVFAILGSDQVTVREGYESTLDTQSCRINTGCRRR